MCFGGSQVQQKDPAPPPAPPPVLTQSTPDRVRRQDDGKKKTGTKEYRTNADLSINSGRVPNTTRSGGLGI